VFPFVKFPGIDVVLSPEMKSTGEVMGIDFNHGLSYLKTQVAAGSTLPTEGNVFLTVRDIDKDEVIPLAQGLVDLGFNIYSTRGTATRLIEEGVAVNALFKIGDGRPNILDMMESGDVAWVINTPSTGAAPMVDEIQMRAQSIRNGIPITTTISGMAAAV